MNIVTSKHKLVICGIVFLLSSFVLNNEIKKNTYKNNNTINSDSTKGNDSSNLNYISEINNIVFQLNILKNAITWNNSVINNYKKMFICNINYKSKQKNIIDDKINNANLTILNEENILYNMKNIIIRHPYNYLKILENHNYVLPKISLNKKNKYLVTASNMQTYSYKIINSNININNISYHSEESFIGIKNITSLISCSKKLFFSRININYNNIFYFSNYLKNLSTYKNIKTNLKNNCVSTNSKYINNNKVYSQIKSRNTNNVLSNEIKSTKFKLNKLYEILLPFGILGLFTTIIIIGTKKDRLQKLISKGWNIPRNSNKLIISIPLQEDKTEDNLINDVDDYSESKNYEPSDIYLSSLLSNTDSPITVNNSPFSEDSFQEETDSDIISFVNNYPNNIVNHSNESPIFNESSNLNNSSGDSFSTSSSASDNLSEGYSDYPENGYLKVYTTENALPFIDYYSDTSSVHSYQDSSFVPAIPNTFNENILGNYKDSSPDGSNYDVHEIAWYTPFTDTIVDSHFYDGDETYDYSDFDGSKNNTVDAFDYNNDALFPQIQHIPDLLVPIEHNTDSENIQKKTTTQNDQKPIDNAIVRIHDVSLANIENEWDRYSSDVQSDDSYLSDPETPFLTIPLNQQLSLVTNFLSLKERQQSSFLIYLKKIKDDEEIMGKVIFESQIINYLHQKNISLVLKTPMPCHSDIFKFLTQLMLERKNLKVVSDHNDSIHQTIMDIISNGKPKSKLHYTKLTSHGWFRKPLKPNKTTFIDYELSVFQYDNIRKQHIKLDNMKKLIGNTDVPSNYKKKILEDIEMYTGESKTMDAKSVIISTSTNEILFDLVEIIEIYKSHFDIEKISKLKFRKWRRMYEPDYMSLSSFNHLFLVRNGSDIKHTGISEKILFEELSRFYK